MAVVTSQDPIFERTRELCRAILDHPKFSSMQETIQSFLGDTAARTAYEKVIEMSDSLDSKQDQGIALTEAEIEAYESARERLLRIPVASEFLRVQKEIHKVQETVHQYVAKTFELGRLPDDADFDEGSCGPSCGCSN